MSGIRVTYSNLISLTVGLGSVITGLVFTLIVTRELTPQEFGTWSLLNGLIIYVTIIEPLISYWSTREISRGTESGRTALFFSGIFSSGAIIAYLIIAYFVGLQSNADLNILFLAAILVPVVFLNYTLNAINTGWKPHSVSYGFLVFEVTKVPMALLFVYFFGLGIEGAILAVFVAYLSSNLTLVFYAKEKLRTKINVSFLRKWIKVSWLPLYHNIPPLLFLSDIVVFSVITGSVTGVAYYGAATAIGKMVQQTRNFSRALYPKMLANGKQEHLQENLIRLFYFAFPLTALSIALAKPGLFSLNPLYVEAVPIVIFLTFRSLLSVINTTFFKVLSGIEKVDVNENSKFKDYIRSKLFFLPTLRIIQYAVYVGILTSVLFLLIPSIKSDLDLVMYWSIVAFIIEIPFTIILLKMVKKNFTLKIDYASFFKYLFTSIVVFGLLYLFVEEFLDYRLSIFEFLPDLIAYVSLGVVSYFGITYLIDNRTRQLFKAIINEIKQK